MRFLCKENVLTASIYINLHRKVNLKGYRREDVETAIVSSLYSVVASDDKRPIGIACVVGDDRIASFIEDAVVDPAYQKNRTGNLLMQKLQEYLTDAAYEGIYTSLMSTPNCVSFYKEHSFLERPCDGMGPGMVELYDPCEMRR